ncbi:hypothetical protein BOX15_Mlig029328g1 [Macrostomum lignano]|uniref:Tubulin--tyrosine ligase-like protein 9 n=1 Tax=Macrostomum lignano TaxID=282301 RepID=A0A267FDF2_9PLAT|nr:hypothetical protein BOX15_Mlig029328g1 [Macrostomum lignano]
MASNTFDAVYAQRSVAEASAQERATLEDVLSEENLPLESTEVRPPPPLPPPLPPSLQQQTALAVNGKVGKRRPLFGIGSTKKSAAASQAVKQRMLHSQSDTGRSKKEDKSKRQRHTPTNNSEVSKRDSRAQSEEYIFTKSIDVSMNNPNADFDELKLSPFYEGYDTRNLLEKWRGLPSRLTINDWAFFIRTTRRRSQRSQVDRLVGDVCAKVLSMREMMQYSLDSGAHCLLWVNSGLARRFLPRMRRGSQILGRVQGDVIVKDKQNLASLLIEHQFREWLEWPTHVCVNEKNEEIKRNNQRLCRHQYIGHYMGKCIDDDAPNCPNHEYYFCECFRKHFFVPEFFAFSHYYLMEQFLKKYETDMEFKKTVWLAKPAYLTGGKGFFLIRDAMDFRYFYLVRSDTCVRREGFTLQRYLPRPCTLNRLKVDCRMYLMITVLNGRRVCGFFHPGFARTAAVPWTVKFEQLHQTKMSGNVFEHITAAELYKLNNARVPGESEEDDDDEKAQCFAFNDACEQIATGAKKVKKGEVENVLPFAGEDADSGKFLEKDFDKFHWRFKYMIEVLCAKLDPIVRDKPGTFQIFGLDILIDSDTKPWLLEVNSHVATEQIYDRSQCRVISNVVTEAICIVVELFQKAFEEEAIAMEIQQGEAPLIKLTRAQRLMTAKAEQDALDKLAGLLEMTEISQRKPPIFLQNFFWWYDTPRYRWIKPWVTRKRRPAQSIPWYSQTFINLVKRNEAIVRKNFKADEATASHDYMDYFRHAFWREKTEEEMKEFEEELLKRAAKVRNPGGSANNASATPDSDF